MEPENRIILTVPSRARVDELRTLNGVVRVSPEAELAIRALCCKTGLTQRHIASELIIQAAAICEIQEEGCAMD